VRGSASFSQKAYEALRRDIVTCIIAPGELISQPQLVERYGIGSTPIREAMQRLVQERLIGAVGRVGYVVTPITYSDVCEIYEMRIILETAAMQLAMERGSDSELTAIADSADFRYADGDIDSELEFVGRNFAFHLSIAAVSRNQRLVDGLSQLLHQSQRILFANANSANGSLEAREGHLAIADALCARDLVRGTGLVRRLLQHRQQLAIQQVEVPLKPHL
jgi:DNA-binding GntR family transcriptional regulator